MLKYLQKMLLIVALCVPWVTQAQSLGDYTFSTGTDASMWIDVPTSQTSLITPGAGDYGVSTVQNIGFSFPFGTEYYTQFSVNADGNLRFGGTVTGTTNYTTPFSTENVAVNNPKINVMGCDGFLSDSGYVRKYNTVDDNDDSLLVIEFATSTYNTSSRPSLLRWQIHLYPNGNINIVYASTQPPILPAVSRQCGMCIDATDLWLINASNVATHYTAGQSTTIATGTWPAVNTFYSFVRPVITCPAPSALTLTNLTSDGVDVSWTPMGTESQWEITCNGQTDVVSSTIYSISNLQANTPYEVSVRAICGVDDTSFAATTAFRTPCLAISQLPYSNDFENEPYYSSGGYSYADAFPECWTRINDATGTYNYYPYISTTSTYLIHGGKSMYWFLSSTSSYADNEYAILPPVDLDVYSISDLTLSFWAKTTSTAAPYPQFITGVMTNPNDVTTFVPLDTVTLTTTATQYIVSLANYNGTGNYIAIRCPRTSTSTSKYASLDDIYLTDEWCDIVENVHASAGMDEITISWESDEGTNFTVFLGQDTVTSVTDTFYTFQNLNSDTVYNYGVANECSNGISMFVTGNIRTLCEYIDSLPYSYGFEDMSTGSSSVRPEIPCWHHLNNGTSYPGYPYVSSTTPHSGTRNLYWFGSTTTGTYGDYQIVVLPAVDTTVYPINTLQLTFWARPSSTSYNPVFQVGVMSDPNDPTSFQMVEEVHVAPNTTWQEFTTMFGAFTGSGNFVAVRMNRPASSLYAYTDDFTLDLMPACPPVADLTVDSMSIDWAQISWTDMGSGTAWVVEYDTVDFVPGSGNASVIDNATDSNYYMSDLEAGRTYYVYVRADCGSDTSIFEGFTVTTLASLPATVPYTCDFEDNLTNGWDFVQNGQHNYWMVGNATNNGGTKSMYVTNNGSANSYDGSASYSFAIRTFNLTDAGEYAYSYDWKCNGEGSFDFLRAAIVPVGTPITAGDYSGFNNGEAPSGTVPAGGIALDGSGRLNLQTSWQTRSGSFTIAEPGTYKMVFLWRNDASIYNTPPAAIDNIILFRNTCPAPINLTATDVTADEITISWQPTGEESSWLVSNGIDEYVVNDTFYVFDNLNSSTGYNFSVQAICGDGDSSMAISTTVYTACLFASLPIIENFDGIPGSTATSPVPAGYLPPCWDIYNDGTRTNYQYAPYVYNSATYSHSGSNCIRFYSYNSSGDSNQYLILPLIDSTETLISDLQLSFWLRAQSTSTNYFANVVVGVMTDPLVESSFIPYDTVSSSVTTYNYYEVNFNHYTGPQGRVTLLFPNPLTSNQYEYGYVDDITLGYIPTCLSVDNLTSVYSATDSIILSWNPGATETAWIVDYDSGSYMVYDTFFVADQLSPSTEYTFSVRAYCGDGDTSYAISTSARTQCGPITVLPYTESFEGLPAGTSSNLDCGVPCWGRLDNATTYHFGYIGSPSSWPTGGHTGSGFLYYYMPTTPGTYADWILTILPAIDETVYPLNTLQVSFWVKMNSATTEGDVQVGIITNINQDSTFVPLDTVHVAGNVYDLKTAYLSGFTGTAGNIALKFLRDPGTTTYYFVDDVTVEPIPDCPPVSSIALAGIDSNMLSVTWSENGDATSWTVEYGLHGFTPGTGTTATATAVPFTINGLTPNTEYDFYITPECTSGVAATRMGTFRTANVYIQLPLSCNFEDASQNTIWTLENGTNTNKWHIGTATNNGGTHALYISDNNGTSNSYTISSSTVDFAYTDVMISTPGDYAFSFDWKCQGESTLDYIRAALVPVTETLTAGTTLPTGLSATAMPSGWISLDGNSKLNLQGTWQTRTDVISVASAGVYHLVFVFRCDLSVGTQPPAAIDNVELARVDCSRPENITLSNLTQTSVDVAWDAVGTATTWEYQLGNNAPVVVTDTFCSFTGLTANTLYTFRVRSICGQGDTSFWMPYTFRTPCGYISLPYTQDFENETTGSSTTGSAFANCWTRLNNGTSYGGYPYVGSSSSYNHTTGGTKGLYWYNTTTATTYGDYQCIVLPPVDPSVGVDSLQLSFWAKASSASYVPVFQIGVMTDPNNIATFEGVDTVTVTTGTTWMNIEVPLTTYAGSGKYIAVKADRPTSTWSAYVDDFFLDYTPSCLAPQDVHVTAATTTSITLDWTDLTAASQWELEYTGNGSTNTTMVSAHPFTLNNLSPASTYAIRIRAICAIGDTSYWTLAENVATGCDLIVPPYYQDFNAITGTTYDAAGVLPPCWEGYSSEATTSYMPHVTNGGTYSYSVSGNAITMTSGSSTYGGDTKIVRLPAFATPVNTLTVSYWMCTESSTNGYLEVGYLTGTNYATDFVGIRRIDASSATVHNGNGAQPTYGVYDTVSFDTVPATALYVAFKWVYTTSYYSCCIDNIEVTTSGPVCNKPVLAGETHNYNSATLNWNSTATDFEISVKAVNEAVWPAETPVTGNSYNVTGLTPATEYQFRIRAICDATENLISDWTIGTFTTDSLPCFEPSNIHTEDIGYTTATLAWTAAEGQNQWSIHVWNSARDTDYVANANPFTITGLRDSTRYFATVKAICGNGATESGYSDTVEFTTGTCAQVTGVNVTNLQAHSATINWSSLGVDTYEIEYGNQNFSQGMGQTVVVEGGNTSYNLTGLTDDHTYSVFVRAKCEDNVYGKWSTKVDFTTPEETGITTADGTNLSIFPNPTSNVTTVSVNGVNGEVSITIVDMNGRTVMSDSMECEGGCTKSIEVSGLAQGAYFVRVSGDNLNMVKKLIVK